MSKPREPEQADEPLLDEEFDDMDAEFVRWRWPERERSDA